MPNHVDSGAKRISLFSARAFGWHMNAWLDRMTSAQQCNFLGTGRIGGPIKADR
jgi:hypothetical protein